MRSEMKALASIKVEFETSMKSERDKGSDPI